MALWPMVHPRAYAGFLVEDGSVLDIGVFAYGDGAVVPPEDGVVPDAHAPAQVTSPDTRAPSQIRTDSSEALSLYAMEISPLFL